MCIVFVGVVYASSFARVVFVFCVVVVVVFLSVFVCGVVCVIVNVFLGL